MEIFRTIHEMQAWSLAQKRQGKTIGIVPTMGFLHEGHLSLIDAARANGAELVVVTIFVNPIQFAPNEDFDSYPRDFEHDRALCEEKKADAIFAPTVKEMYPAPEIVKAAFDAGVNITFGSDSHSPSDPGRDFDLAAELAKSAGYRSAYFFRRKRPVELPFD